MKNSDFKAGIKAELKNDGFTENKLNTITYGDEGTIIFFMQDVMPESQLALWLQKRFRWGVTITKNQVRINTPKQNNKTQPQLTKKEIKFMPSYTYKFSDGVWIAHVYMNLTLFCKVVGETKEIAHANAERIVKGVNQEWKVDMHDNLIEAVKWALNTCKEIQSKKSSGMKFPETASLGSHLEDLLKQAEQK